jgi:Yip1 domain/Deuterolysin metalloprotease (M35) family
MTTATSSNASLIDRVKNILLSPSTEWPIIAAESGSVADIYTKYAIPLALIPAIASFLAFGVFGYSFGPLSMKTSIGSALVTAVLTFVLSLVMLYVIAWIVNALAPTFDGQKNAFNAFKLVAYSYTASFLAGALVLIPYIGMLSFLVGLYSLYLLYTGLPVLMKNPPAKTMAYFVVSMLCGIVASVTTFALVSCLAPTPKMSMGDSEISINTPMGKMKVDTTKQGSEGGTVTIKAPDGKEIKIEAKTDKDTGKVTINAPGASIELDAKKMEEFAKQMEIASKKMEEASKSGDPTAALKAIQEAMKNANQAPAK